MDELFPMRPKLRNDILAYRTEHGLDPAGMAVALGKSPGSLKSILYDHSRHVGTAFLQAWCSLSGHSLTEYLDDPGAPVAGVPKDAFGQATEEERVMLRAMASDLAKLRPELRRPAFDAWAAIVRGFQVGDR